jgi:hypothetical protein
MLHSVTIPSKKVRLAWDISQVIIDLILGWFFKNHSNANQGKHGIAF